MNYITFWKKFLLKCFIINLVFLWISFLLWYLIKDFSFEFTHNIFAIDKTAYNKIVLDFFAASKFVMYQVFLIPCLALYWMSKCQKQDWKKNINLDE